MLERFIPTYVGHAIMYLEHTVHITVHPHIRGAYQPHAVRHRELRGSSPHTWGIPRAATVGRFQGRFIPTYVGHTASSLPILVHLPVHPHIRGAYKCRVDDYTSSDGSSPHTWGILLLFCAVAAPMRFIPTYVGHTIVGPSLISCSSVHPHIRGAYSQCRRR